MGTDPRSLDSHRASDHQRGPHYILVLGQQLDGRGHDAKLGKRYIALLDHVYRVYTQHGGECLIVIPAGWLYNNPRMHGWYAKQYLVEYWHIPVEHVLIFGDMNAPGFNPARTTCEEIEALHVLPHTTVVVCESTQVNRARRMAHAIGYDPDFVPVRVELHGKDWLSEFILDFISRIDPHERLLNIGGLLDRLRGQRYPHGHPADTERKYIPPC